MAELDFISISKCSASARTWKLRPHTHRFHEIYLLIEGSARAVFDDYSVEGKVGDVLFHPRDVEHYPAKVGKARMLFLHLRWNGYDELVDTWTTTEPVFDRQGHIRYLLNWMLDLFPVQSDFDNRMLTSMTQSVIEEMTRLQTGDSSDLVERIRRYAWKHLAEPITLDQLAAEACLSKYHFVRKFKKLTGHPPKRFLNEIRLEAARNLILETDMTFDAVAAQVGLSDGSYLSHVFRRLTGKSPSQLRR